jgi:hypothetical protein
MVRISFLSHHILSDLHIVSFITILRHGGLLSEAYLELRELFTKKIWKINGFAKKIWKTAGFGQDNKNLVKMLERPCEVVPTRLCLLASAPHE